MREEGYYRLSQVCRVYGKFPPCSYGMLKREADRREDSLGEIGILKYDTKLSGQHGAFSTMSP